MTHTHDSYSWLILILMTHTHDSYSWLILMTHTHDSYSWLILMTHILMTHTHDSYSWLILMTHTHDSYINSKIILPLTIGIDFAIPRFVAFNTTHDYNNDESQSHQSSKYYAIKSRTKINHKHHFHASCLNKYYCTKCWTTVYLIEHYYNAF